MIETNQTQEKQPRDASFWAQPVDRLKVGQLPAEAVNLNVEGRQVMGPLQGFGQLWQKTYRVRLPAGTAGPREVIKTWKEEFPGFWPEGNRFYGPLTGIQPGEVAILNLTIPNAPIRLSTGVMVLYADEESFSLMTPQGHMFAGWNTFSAYQEGHELVIQVQVLVRPSDPVWEIGMRLFGFKEEDRFWSHTVEAVARRFGVEARSEMEAICVDPRWQWRRIGNVWHNAAIRSTLHSLTAPLRWLGRLAGR